MSKTDNKKNTPDAQTLTALARQLVGEQTTLTLATAEGDTAWAAPVYYVYEKSTFYFLSSPTSRHITEALRHDQASAAIHAAASTWKEIRAFKCPAGSRRLNPA